MKRKLVVTIVAIFMLQCNAVPVSANTEAIEAVTVEATVSDDMISPRAEETEWKVRMKNGVMQKRLWSITYAEWIGEWIDI